MMEQYVKTEGNGGDWLSIEISVQSDLSDALNNFLTEIGAAGAFQETPEGIAPDSSSEHPFLETLKAFLPIDNVLEKRLAELQVYIDSLAEIFPDMPKPVFRTEVIRNPDWGEAWKKYFKPLRVSRNIVIKPTWEDYLPDESDIVIDIDPGMAFGTGQHASTRMCLEAIDGIMQDAKNRDLWSVLDVGTGTGILGIAFAKLGAGRVLCIDNDHKATEIARKNVIVNQAGATVTASGTDIADVEEEFHAVVANLTAKVLLELHTHLARLVRSGGFLIISGIIAQNRPEVEAGFSGNCFKIIRVISEKEWLCYLLKKEVAPSCQ